MSDYDAAPDPMDKAYVQADAALDDAAERAARRARVLTAVSQSAAATPDVPAAQPPRRPAWRRGGWLVAASVGGLSVFLATHVNPPSVIRPPLAPPTTTTPVPAAPAVSVQPAPEGRDAAPTPERARATAIPSRSAGLEPRSRPPALAEPSLGTAQTPQGGPPAAAARSSAQTQELVVTGQRIPAPVSDSVFARPVDPSSMDVVPPGLKPGANPDVQLSTQPAWQERKPSPSTMPKLAAGLRAAAQAGRTSEVAVLLAQGVPVDATDAAGETALMKAVRAEQPAAVAQLRRAGASPDLRNHAGLSARDLAAPIANPNLDRALAAER